MAFLFFLQDKRFVRFDLTPSGKEFSINTQEFININWQKSLEHMDANNLKIFNKLLFSSFIHSEHTVSIG